jgi:thiamine biosynthesis protein ThiS
LRVTVNGEVRETAPGATVVSLLASLGIDPRKVAVEHNREIVPKSRYDRLVLEPDDALEIVQFVGGG